MACHRQRTSFPTGPGGSLISHLLVTSLRDEASGFYGHMGDVKHCSQLDVGVGARRIVIRAGLSSHAMRHPTGRRQARASASQRRPEDGRMTLVHKG